MFKRKLIIAGLALSMSSAFATSHEGHDHKVHGQAQTKYNYDYGEKYEYKQKFMPREVLDLDLSKTAIFITDPQNSFMAKDSPIRALVGPVIEGQDMINNLKKIIDKATEHGMTIFYSPHMYTQNDFDTWQSINGIDKIMFYNKMFLKGSKGFEFLPELAPNKNTVVLNPHKGLSNFWTGDAALQLRERGITTLIMGGMAANMCVESHARDAIENGFDLILVADAVAAAGEDATNAAITNYEFIGHEVLLTNQVLTRLDEASKKGKKAE